MMKRRALSLLLALSLLCGLTPAGLTASAEEYSGLCGENLRYVINTDTGLLTISGTGEVGMTAPWKNYDISIRKVVIEPGITAIGGKGLFQDMSFSELVLPDTLTSIGEMAFAGCKKLEAVVLPESLAKLGACAFDACWSLTSVTLPEGLAEIPRAAFRDCIALPVIDIPASVKTVGESAFSSCYELKRVVLREGLERIGDRAFAWTALDKLTVPATVTTIEDAAFYGIEELKTVVMLGGTALPNEIFAGCTSLERVKLPVGLEAVGHASFSGCTSLTRLDFPTTVKEMMTPIAGECPSLKTVVISNPDTELNKWGWDYSVWSFGVPGQTVLYSDSPAVKQFAIKFGYDCQSLGSEPEDDWDPFAGPSPVPVETPTPGPAETPTPGPAETPTPGPAETPTPAPKSFEDVKPGDWFYQAVNWAVANGVTSGTSVNRFGAKDLCDRSQAVFFLWAASGRPEPQSASNPFWDVSPSAYYYKAVLWAVESNITGGTNAAGTTFSPTQDCSRGQIVTFLYAAKGRPTPPRFNKFNDIKTGVYYDKPANWAAKEGVTGGTNAAGTAFSPNRKCTRAEIVSFLYKAYQ